MVARKEDVLQIEGDVDDDFRAGEGTMSQVADRAHFRVGSQNAIGEFGQFRFAPLVRRHAKVPQADCRAKRVSPGPLVS